MNKSYVFIDDYKAPYVVATGMAHKPSRIMIKRYKKGEIIEGELKLSNGKPSIVLIRGVIPVPVTMLRAVVTKEIIQNADGGSQKPTQPKVVVGGKSSAKYLDAGIMGAIFGAVAVYLAEKQGWIASADKKNKLYGAAIGGALAMYLVYRNKK